jgi:hypothetical protein
MILPYSKRTQQKEEIKMAKIPRRPSGGAFGNSIPKKTKILALKKKNLPY